MTTANFGSAPVWIRWTRRFVGRKSSGMSAFVPHGNARTLALLERYDIEWPDPG